SRRSSSCSRLAPCTWKSRRTSPSLPAPEADRPRGAPGPSRSRRSPVFNNLGNLAELMRNAGRLRESVEKVTASLGQIQAEGAAGGGVVAAVANGRLELLSVRIDPKLLADGDAELLEDLVTAAVNQALVKAREAAARSIPTLAGGLPIPGLSGLLGQGGGGA